MSGPEHDCALAALLPADPHADLARFALYWLSRRTDGPIPHYADIDPTDIPWALDAIYVIERRDDGLFAFRLAGEAMSLRIGESLKGKTAYDLFDDEYAAWTQARWERCRAERLACFVDTRHDSREGRPMSAQRLHLPVLDRHGAPDMQIGLNVFTGLSRREQFGPDQPGERVVRWTRVDDLPFARP
ncbi:MAG: PAS domain-containing protein [Minwuia sp.]|uniref:PAS domain-containing protein n=1 Tax=Minwuia sp. TaxID=2493630 RepID=UPI003A8B5D85